jgi:hypothetical protein
MDCPSMLDLQHGEMSYQQSGVELALADVQAVNAGKGCCGHYRVPTLVVGPTQITESLTHLRHQSSQK